jgi:hypothetical protein
MCLATITLKVHDRASLREPPMDNFGVSAVRWNSGHTQIAECLVHRLTKRGGHYGCDEAQRLAGSDVAGLIGHDYQVWVMTTRELSPEFDELVQVEDDESGHLYSTPRNSLLDLPEF